MKAKLDTFLCKADEDTRKQTTEIQNHTGTAESKMDAMKTKYKSKKQFIKPKPTYQKESVQHTSSKTIIGCRYCGKTHRKDQCSAYCKLCFLLQQTRSFCLCLFVLQTN